MPRFFLVLRSLYSLGETGSRWHAPKKQKEEHCEWPLRQREGSMKEGLRLHMCVRGLGEDFAAMQEPKALWSCHEQEGGRKKPARTVGRV